MRPVAAAIVMRAKAEIESGDTTTKLLLPKYLMA